MLADDVQERIARLSNVKRRLLEQQLRSELPGATPDRAIERVPGLAQAPLSHAQRAVWLHQSLHPDVPLYNRPRAYRLRGRLEVEILAQALRLLVRRQAVLRTRIVTQAGEPMQAIHPDARLDIRQVDLQAVPDAEALLAELLPQEAAHCFDLAVDAPLRVVLFRLAPDHHVLLFVHHYIAFDHWSISLFNQELSRLYTALLAEQATAQLQLPLDYASYAAWQVSAENERRIAAHADYWRYTLAKELPVLELPTDRPRCAPDARACAAVDCELPPSVVDRLEALARAENATLFMVLLAGLQTLLSRYTQAEEIAVGAVIANRQPIETEELIGNFSNLLVLRAGLAGNPTFRQLVRRVRGITLNAYTHRDVPLERLIEQMGPADFAKRQPFFQVLLDYLSMPIAKLRLSGLQVEAMPLVDPAGAYPLKVLAVRSGARLALRLQYQQEVFAPAAAQRIAGHLQTLLTAIAAEPDQHIGSLPILTNLERLQLAQWSGSTAAEVGAASAAQSHSLVQMFEAQVAQHPRTVAFASDTAILSYSELNVRANRLANYLAQAGVENGARVGVCLERSLTAVIAVLAVFKLSAVYIPLDPSYPEERLRYIAADSHAEVIITVRRQQSALRFSSGRSGLRVLCLEDLTAQLQGMPYDNLKRPVDPNDVAYVIYTSGSTGTPKGVEIPHRQILNRLAWMWEAYPFAPDEIGVLKMPLNFVDALWETFGYLLKGIPTVVLSDDVVRDPAALVEALAKHGVTRLWLTPSRLQKILQVAPDLQARLPRLRFWVATGEPLPLDLVRAFAAAAPHAVLYNLYGASEVWDVTWYDPMREQAPASGAVAPIGRPILNTQALILDRRLQPVPVGVTGELFVGGLGLGKGYCNRPELTKEYFVPHPLAAHGGRLYRTGDLARLLPDGNLEFVGRADYQVKLRGFRVELGEIEVLLRELDEVREAAVILHGEGDARRLVAYLTAVSDQRPDAATLRSYLAQRLPAYMLPAYCMWLDQMPCLPNGKINRAELPAPPATPLIADEVDTAPRVQREVRSSTVQPGVLPGAQRAVSAPVREAWRTAIPIQPHGSRPPFFCVHGYGGSVAGYAALAQRLGEDQPFYGLQARGLDGKEAPDTTVTAMAERYVAAMRLVQPTGLYRIGGYGFGGAIAFEMARQLEAAGDRVALLAIIEGSAPAASQGGAQLDPGTFRTRCLATLMRTAPYWWRDYLGLSVAELRGRLGRRTAATYDRVAHKLGWNFRLNEQALLPISRAQLPELRRRLLGAQLRACSRYQAGPYGGRVTLFRAGGRNPNRSLFGGHGDAGGWDKISAHIEVIAVEGTPRNLLHPPQVRSLAAALRCALDIVVHL